VSDVPANEPSPPAQVPLAYESQPSLSSDAISIGSIALKLVGLYCIVLALPVISYLGLFFQGRFSGFNDIGMVVLSLTPYLLYVAAGVALMRWGDRLAHRLFARGPIVSPLQRPPGEYIQAVAFSVAGLVTILHSLPRLAYSIYQTRLLDLRREGIFVSLGELALGLIVFLRAKGLSLLWHKIRTAGAPENRV